MNILAGQDRLHESKKVLKLARKHARARGAKSVVDDAIVR
jgi:hypothetical protein